MSSSPGSSTHQLLQRGVDFVRSPLFFRIWAMWGAVVMAIWALYALHPLSWFVQPVYCALLFVTWFTTSKDVCARCRHRGTWHCGGQGMLVERFFPERKGVISADEYQLHGLLLCLQAGFTIFALFSHHMFAGLFGVAWLSLVILVALPRDGNFSWYIGLVETRRRAEAATRQDAPTETDADVLELDTEPKEQEQVLESPDRDMPWEVDFDGDDGNALMLVDDEELPPLEEGDGEGREPEPSDLLPYADFGLGETPPKEAPEE